MTQLTLFDTRDTRIAFNALENHFEQHLTGYEAFSSEGDMIDMVNKDLIEQADICIGMQRNLREDGLWHGYVLPVRGGNVIGTLAIRFHDSYITLGFVKGGSMEDYKNSLTASPPIYTIEEASRIIVQKLANA